MSNDFPWHWLSEERFRWLVVVLLGLIVAGLLVLERGLKALHNMIFDYLYDHKGFRRKVSRPHEE